MNLDWIVSPIAQLALLAAGLIACLTLFVSTKIEIARQARRYASQVDSQSACLGSLTEEVGRISRTVETLESPRANTAMSGVNLSRRTQILRLQGRGEAVETIAATLQMPRNEVELALKLHRILDGGGRLTQ